MGAARLESRSGVGKGSLSVNNELIGITGACAAHVSGEISASILRQGMLGSVDDRKNAFMLIRPNSQMSSRVVDLSSHRIPPREGRALYRFFNHSVLTPSPSILFNCLIVRYYLAFCGVRLESESLSLGVARFTVSVSTPFF